MLKTSLLKNKFIYTSLFAIFILLFVCGCTVKNTTKSTENQVTFKDALSREVCVNKHPKRVAALIGSFADVWQLAGGEICATAEDAWDDFGLSLENCVNIGGAHSPSLEKLLASEPDFVIASASTSADVQMRESLENAGITVAYFDVDSFEDYLDMLRICTDITGRKDLYKKNGLEIKDRIDGILKDYQNLNVLQENQTVLLLRASSGSVKAKGSEGTVLGEMLKSFGCKNIADSNKTLLEALSIESIIANEPYRIFVVSMGDDEKAIESIYKMINDNPAWKNLDAIKKNRFHIMERRLFNIKPNADWAKSYEKLSEILLDK